MAGFGYDDRRIGLSHYFLLVVALITLVFGLLNLFYFEFLLLAAVELAVFCIVVVALADLYVNRNVERSAWTAVLAFGALVVFFYGYIRAEFSASVWLGLFAMINFFLLGTKTAVPVYLCFSGIIVAMIVVNRGEWPALRTDAALSNILGALVAFGLMAYYQERSRERAHDRIQELANTDPLTGIANRRHFVNRFSEAREQLQASGSGFALVLVDIDDFKLINDTHGHIVGDEVIGSVCRKIATLVRDGDLVGRLGGEEFGVLLLGCDLDSARRRAEAIRQAISRRPLVTAEQSIPVTVSVGVAAGDPRAHGFRQLFTEADRHLYQAKAEGRDRVIAGTADHSG
jgi:diguanylate cyclase (GGDEF)-like protein